VERDCGIPVAMLNITVYGLPSRELPTFGLGLPFNNTPIGQLRNMVLGYVGTNIIFGPVQKRWREVCDRNGWEFVPFGPTAPKSLYLQPSVPAFEYPVSHIPSQVHFIGALLPETPAEYVPPAWWTDLKAEAQRTRRPIILVTQGTIATDADHLIAPTLRALANEEVLVVATTGGKTALEAGLTVPANARVEPFIPFGLIMSEVAVMITNGGYGGLTIAIANGVPVITAGTTEDKAEVGQRVGYTGVGINLKTNAPTPDQVRGAVRRLLTTPAYREAARRIQQEIARRDAPNTAVDLLEALATTRQPVYRR
jgi:UDP:flavonoid glycosyltransferase YjiC (YdhE family)